MGRWLDFEQSGEDVFIELSQFKGCKPKGTMYCRCCEKKVKSFYPSACNGNKRKDKQYLLPPTWLKMRSFCAKCGWMFKLKAIPSAVKKAVVKLDGDVCVYCGGPPLPGYPLEFDHLIPQIMGGEATEQNIVQACYFCNIKKGRKEDFPRPIFGRFAKKGTKC